MSNSLHVGARFGSTFAGRVAGTIGLIADSFTPAPAVWRGTVI